MDHLFNASMSKRVGFGSRKYSASCGDIPAAVLYTTAAKKRSLKGALFNTDGRPSSPSSGHAKRMSKKGMSNSELVNVVDAQLIQIREKLATLREQDIEFRERSCGDHFNQPLERCFHMRRAISDPTSIHIHRVELSKEEAATQNHCRYPADHAIHLYPQYNNPEDISTLF